jgi:hypothetical protein
LGALPDAGLLTEQELLSLYRGKKMECLNDVWNWKKRSLKELSMQNEIYRHRKGRLPIEYGGARFTTGSVKKADEHGLGCYGD